MGVEAKPSLSAVCRNPTFTLLWLAQLAAAMGSALTGITASILVFRLTGSVYSVGMMLLATSGPTLVVGLLAGVFVDRKDRKRIIWLSYLIRAVLVALIPLLLPYGLLWVYLIVAISSAVAQFTDSAQASVLPEITEDRDLPGANALLAISSALAMTLGFAMAGFITSSQDVAWVFLLNSFTFVVAAGLILPTHIPALPPSPFTSIRLIGSNLKAGLQFLQQTPILRTVLVMITPIFVVMGFQNSLLLPFSTRILGGTEFHYGFQQSVETLGIILGCILMTRFAPRLRDGQWLAVSYLGLSIVMLMYTFCASVVPAIALMGLSGLLIAPSTIGRQLIIQRSTPREMRGRVNSAFLVVRDITYVTGMTLAGLADMIDLRILFLISSTIILVASVAAIFAPGLRQTPDDWKSLLSQVLPGRLVPSLFSKGRPATRQEVDQFLDQTSAISGMPESERDSLALQTRVIAMHTGDSVLVQGEDSDSAYFILKGKVNVGYTERKKYEFLNTLDAGQLFGEVAALTGNRRTADVRASADSEFLVIPSTVLRELASRHAGFKAILDSTMSERLSQIELPRINRWDHRILQDLRTDTKKK